MKKAVLSILTFVFSATLTAQELKPVTGEQQKAMTERITEASAKMKSLSCDFEQVKELSILDEKMISKGKMNYRQESRLRWEYLEPYTYLFVLNDKKLLMQAETTRNVMDVKSSKMFQEIVKIMMNSINGKGLTEIESFDNKYFTQGNKWVVELIPTQKEIKRIFSSITLTFNINDYTIDNVKLFEQNGDNTIITLLNKQFNKEIGDSVFHID